MTLINKDSNENKDVVMERMGVGTGVSKYCYPT